MDAEPPASRAGARSTTEIEKTRGKAKKSKKWRTILTIIGQLWWGDENSVGYFRYAISGITSLVPMNDYRMMWQNEKQFWVMEPSPSSGVYEIKYV